ncbi:hypothetical protein INR49_023600 [Caranx melampygus]|nr:hypothetical protein INR49_023600 [Caranx melampygus]
MEATGRTALYVFCSVLFILTEVSSDFIHIPSLVHHGIVGKPLLLSVETRFPLDDAEIQGTWSHTRPSGSRTTLVTFTKEATITDMMYRNHLRFEKPNRDRVVFQWLRDNTPLSPSDRYHFSRDNSTLLISPVKKEDKGIYRCLASNPVSPGRHSRSVELNVYYGPYNLEVNSGQGLRTGEVFTINPGELAFFECQADSNPPNSYVWISKSRNSTRVITEGPRLEVRSYRLAQTEKYLCRAFNNVTQKQDEAQFTLVVAGLGTGKEMGAQKGGSVSPLGAIAVCSLFIIGCMLLFFSRDPAIPREAAFRAEKTASLSETCLSTGHEDATEDFGIYEFVSIPGKMESAQVSCRSLARFESVQDMHTTIYDVIRHVPETPSHSLLK